MEDSILQEKPGFFSFVACVFARTEIYEDEIEETSVRSGRQVQLKANYRYTVFIRRHILNFEDAMAAAAGLKSGEAQLLNLAGTDPQTRQKIVDFMCGVNFAQEGSWEEVGEHIYLIAPSDAYVEVVPSTARSMAVRN